MRRSIVLTSVLVVGLLIAGYLTGCSPKIVEVEKIVKETVEVEKVVKETVVVEKQVAPPAGPVQLRFTTFGSQEEYDVWDEIIGMWKQEHPNIDVVQEPMPWTNLTEKMIANAMGGTAADVQRLQLSNASRFNLLGMFLPLDDFINGPDGVDLDIYFESGLQMFNWNGVQYAFPQSAYNSALYYNVDMYQEAGLAPPDETWTWDELKQAAQKLTIKDAGGEISQYGFVQDSWNVCSWIYGSGGWIYDPMLEGVVWDTPEAIAAGKLIQSMVHELDVNPPLGLLQTLGGGGQLFQQERAAMWPCVAGPVGSFTVQTPDLNFAVTWMPPREQGKFGTFASPDAYAIWAGTTHPTESWMFLKYLLSPEIQSYWYERLGSHKPNNKISWDTLGDKIYKDPHSEGFWWMTPYEHAEAWLNPNGNEVYFNIFNKEAVEEILKEESRGLTVEEVWGAAAVRANQSQADFWVSYPAYRPEIPIR